MVVTAYDQNDTRRLSIAFTNIAAAATDPTTVTFIMREPDGVLTTYVYVTDAELVKLSTGNFYVDWPIAKPGRHTFRWIGTGSVAAAEAGEFFARRKEAV